MDRARPLDSLETYMQNRWPNRFELLGKPRYYRSVARRDEGVKKRHACGVNLLRATSTARIAGTTAMDGLVLALAASCAPVALAAQLL